MFKDFKNTIAAAVPEIINYGKERFLKTRDEIDGEFRYYSYAQVLELMRPFASDDNKMETIIPPELALTIIQDGSVQLEENY